MTIGTVDAGAAGAVDESRLTASAANIVQIDRANASTKMGITEGNCICEKYALLYKQESTEVRIHSLFMSINFL